MAGDSDVPRLDNPGVGIIANHPGLLIIANHIEQDGWVDGIGVDTAQFDQCNYDVVGAIMTTCDRFETLRKQEARVAIFGRAVVRWLRRNDYFLDLFARMPKAVQEQSAVDLRGLPNGVLGLEWVPAARVIGAMAVQGHIRGGLGQ